MDRKKLVLLLGALIVAIGTALVARNMFAGASAPQAEAAAVPAGPKVLVAQRTLPTGTIITADALGFQPWPKDLVQDAYFIDGEADMSKLLGTVVRHPVTAGEPVTQGSLVAPGDRGFLAAALGPGMRAVTIPVSAKAGVAGFVFPGDRVDLLLSQTVKGDGPALKTTETILRNLRILATDQRTSQETVDGKTRVRKFRTVTVEATPKIAEKIAVAQTLGRLTLTLRSIADSQGELERALANGDVTVPEGATPEEEEAILREAMSRPDDGSSTFVTGGDVSRFQRASVPPRTSGGGNGGGGSSNDGGAQIAQAFFGSPAKVSSGPVVRVTRGKSTSSVKIGANGSATPEEAAQASIFEQMIEAAAKAQGMAAQSDANDE